MPGKNLITTGIILCVLTGCGGGNKRVSAGGQGGPNIEVPPYMKNTVAQYATLVGGRYLPVKAHGVVIGLGDNGSSEVPAHVRRSLVKHLLVEGLGSPRGGTGDLTPERVLSDKDTAVVLISGVVPLGAPRGEPFDVLVSALGQTQTRSLEGGRLMPRELTVAYGGVDRPDAKSTTWGKASGSIFINPFIDPSDPNEAASVLSGRVIGGGTITRDQPARLQLRRPDYATARRIQRRIQERFGREENLLLADVAKGRSRSVVDLNIPPEYRYDYQRFLELVMHLPVQYGLGGMEGEVRRVVKAMKAPGANHHELALIWEAMGRQVLPSIRGMYASKNPGVSYHAARTGLRLKDKLAEEVIDRFAGRSNSPHQLAAIEELGRSRRARASARVLRKLVDDENMRVRIAAYEALRARGDVTVRQIDVGGKFDLDLVRSRREYMIYATQSGSQRIVLFGMDMPIRRPIFFESPGQLLTVNAFNDSNGLTVFRKIPHAGRISDPVDVDAMVDKFIELLGSKPELDDAGKATGLGLTYSQVVGILYRMCHEGDIPGKFVLQQAEGLQRIYKDTATVGRPDMPGS